METKFEMSFLEAMEAVLDGKFVQGEHFAWNVYLVAKNGVVRINSFNEDEVIKYRDEGELGITSGILSQKYREVPILNRSGLFHTYGGK